MIAIQPKRAPSAVPPSLRYLAANAVYSQAGAWGKKKLKLLEVARAKRTIDSHEAMAIGEKNYKDARFIHFAFDTEMDDPYEAYGGGWAYDTMTKNPDDDENYYNNIVYLPSGRIDAVNNDSGKNKAPPSNSSVFWFQYSMALNHFNNLHEERTDDKGDVDASTLSELSRQTITNETTKAVMWMVGFDPKQKTRLVVDPTSPDGHALLGTPNGKSAFWLLYDHLHEIGDKTVTSIVLENDDDGQNMTFQFG